MGSETTASMDVYSIYLLDEDPDAELQRVFLEAYWKAAQECGGLAHVGGRGEPSKLEDGSVAVFYKLNGKRYRAAAFAEGTNVTRKLDPEEIGDAERQAALMVGERAAQILTGNENVIATCGNVPRVAIEDKGNRISWRAQGLMRE